MKTLSLFLKDGKLFGAVMPESIEKPEGYDDWYNHPRKQKYFIASGGMQKIMSFKLYLSYTQSKSEALSQAMEVVNPKLFAFDNGDGWLVGDKFGSSYMKRGEFYTWDLGYEIIEEENPTGGSGSTSYPTFEKKVRLTMEIQKFDISKAPKSFLNSAVESHWKETQEPDEVKFANWVHENWNYDGAHWVRYGNDDRMFTLNHVFDIYKTENP